MKKRYLLMLLGMVMFCACERLTEEDRRNGAYQIKDPVVPLVKYNVYIDTLYVFRVQDITKYNSDYRGSAADLGIVKDGRLSGSTDKQSRNLCLVTDKYGNLKEMELDYNTEVGDTLIAHHERGGPYIKVVNLTLQNKAKAFLKQR